MLVNGKYLEGNVNPFPKGVGGGGAYPRRLPSWLPPSACAVTLLTRWPHAQSCARGLTLGFRGVVGVIATPRESGCGERCSCGSCQRLAKKSRCC